MQCIPCDSTFLAKKRVVLSVFGQKQLAQRFPKRATYLDIATKSVYWGLIFSSESKLFGERHFCHFCKCHMFMSKSICLQIYNSKWPPLMPQSFPRINIDSSTDWLTQLHSSFCQLLVKNHYGLHKSLNHDYSESESSNSMAGKVPKVLRSSVLGSLGPFTTVSALSLSPESSNSIVVENSWCFAFICSNSFAPRFMFDSRLLW